MHKGKDGSALLIVFLLSSLLMLAALNIWRFVIIGVDTSILKQTTERQFLERQGILKWVVKACERNYDLLIEQAPLNFNLIDKKNNTTFKLELKSKDNGLLMTLRQQSITTPYQFLIERKVNQDQCTFLVSCCKN